MGRVFVLTLLSVFLASRPQTQTAENPAYPDSADGFRQQLEDLIAARKSGDAASFRVKLDALAIPNASQWIEGHFLTADVAKLQRDYPLSLGGYEKAFDLGRRERGAPSRLGHDCEAFGTPKASRAGWQRIRRSRSYGSH